MFISIHSYLYRSTEHSEIFSEYINLNNENIQDNQDNRPSKYDYLIYLNPELALFLPPKNTDFNLYGIPQTLYKLHTDLDEILLDVLRMDIKVILSLGCSVISVAFYYLCGYFPLLMPYWLFYVSYVEDRFFNTPRL
jgi:hypothetical protein